MKLKMEAGLTAGGQPLVEAARILTMAAACLLRQRTDGKYPFPVRDGQGTLIGKIDIEDSDGSLSADLYGKDTGGAGGR